ncbi:MAG: NapC/NirT family cytochrome c [Deltaproteobacteria bacterium]|nr:NapC/NirT family cytochrome c [Deltaproteobacteria bacterium]
MSDREGGGDASEDEGATSSIIPNPIYNWMSVIGSVVAAIGMAVAIFLLLIGLATRDESGYSGLILLFPVAFTGLGVALLAAGYIRERRRQKQGRHSSFFERTVVDPWDFVSKTGLAAILAAIIVSTFALLGAGAGSLAVVELSESNEFCGETCHHVMGPEYTAYDHSPHARIDCVECHVGPGGDSYLRAKIGGLRQLWAVATDTVTRPIPTPIHRRRLSDEMCASCHTHDRFIGYKVLTRDYFSAGEDVIPTRLALMVKVGGGGNTLMKGAGIHYHMLVAQKVEYIARDPQRQDIALVRVTREDGGVKEYVNDDDPLTDEERESLEFREMECLDCHSRPAHKFRAPIDSVNDALASRAISPDTPYIKEAAVRALDHPYESTPEALQGIEENLISFYEEEDEDVLESHSEQITKATAVLRTIYQNTIFPEMKVDWKVHPDNAGHRDSPGCFRCHNDVMLDEDDEALFYDCTTCHAVMAQDATVIRTMDDLEKGRDFIHPEDGLSFDEFSLCSDCHTGGAELYD